MRHNNTCVVFYFSIVFGSKFQKKKPLNKCVVFLLLRNFFPKFNFKTEIILIPVDTYVPNDLVDYFQKTFFYNFPQVALSYAINFSKKYSIGTKLRVKLLLTNIKVYN